jgi:ABC-type nickel/cobalt efflux system permease component RcnA
MLTLLAAEGVASINNDFAMQIASGFASLGFAVWYAWHTTTRSIPKMQEDHKQTVERIVEQFREESREMRAAEAQRSARSVELAVSGHEALKGVTVVVSELREAVASFAKVQREGQHG